MQAGNSTLAIDGLKSSTGQLPALFAPRFHSCAVPGESPVAWLETDLDEDLRFGPGLILLTNQRLIAFTPLNGKPSVGGNVQAWRLDASTRLEAEEHAGIGTLQLFEADARLARWRYTAVQAAAAHRLVRRFAALRRAPGAILEESKT